MSSNHTPPPACHKCAVAMKKGTALQSTLVYGTPDFAGDMRGVTVSEGGPGRFVLCWKCPKCGHSITREGT